jgi:hypothetical protein
MPPVEQIDRNNHRCKLKAPKEDLMCHQELLQPLRRLSKPKASPQIDCYRRNVECPQKVPANGADGLVDGVLGTRTRCFSPKSLNTGNRVTADVLARSEEEDMCEDDEDEERENLEG